MNWLDDPFSFYHFSGSGNTFLITERPVLQKFEILSLCKEKKVDGILHLFPSTIADIKLIIYNSDGSEAEMCGNGMRCAVKYLLLNKRQKQHYRVETANGIQHAFVTNEKIGIAFPYPKIKKMVIFEKICYFLNTGVPHVVFCVKDVEDPNWMALAPKIRSHIEFGKAGTNVNFVDPVQLKIRTFERGLERETQSCGTGTVAAANILLNLYKIEPSVSFIPKSQEILTVEFKSDYCLLIGPVTSTLQNFTDDSFAINS